MKLKPCPFCGNADLFTGTTSFLNQGVQCERYRGGCGAQMHGEIPDVRPEGCKTLADVEEHTLKKVVKRWNRRT